MRKKSNSPILLILIILLLAGCATVISEPVLKDVDKTLKFTDIKKDPSAHKGSLALLGGRVIGVSNESNSTLIEVLQFPLSSRMKPRFSKDSEGRFLIRIKGFIDPLVYKGRLITVVGAIVEPITRPLDKTEYRYPVIESRESYLWNFADERGLPISFGIGLGL